MAHVGIIIVTYNPVMKNFENNLSYIKKLKQKILIVDNNSNLKEIKRLRNIAKQNYNVSLIELDKNMGIGYAQNIGINYFKNKGVDFCFFLDQDSYIKEAHFKKLVNDFEQIRIIDKNAVLMGPILNESDLLRDNISKVNKLISSGSLMVLEATSSVGLMKEKFFIDFIDYEWCWRARKKRKNIYQDGYVVLHHETNGVPRKYHHTIDPIFRLFYLYRNGTYIIFHEDIFITQKLELFSKLAGKLLFQFVLESRFKRVSTCIKGIVKGITSDFTKV